jgi:hypothetical protein
VNSKALVLPEQPFVVAGETALTMVKIGPGEYAIRVQRLYGQQGTGFVTLITVNNELPAVSPCWTLDKCAGNPYDTRSKVATIPYAVYSNPSTHNPAVMTKWGVLYAANPSHEMFGEMFRYCRNQTSNMAAMLLSSHGPIRIWRVNAFMYDDPLGVRAVETGGVSVVPDGIPDDMSPGRCGQQFNVRVTSMEYLNDQNIAVQESPAP